MFEPEKTVPEGNSDAPLSILARKTSTIYETPTMLPFRPIEVSSIKK